MAIRVEHDMHQRRLSRNVGLGLVLAAFVALVFALTVVKVQNGAQPPHVNDGKKNSGTVVQQSGGTQP